MYACVCVCLIHVTKNPPLSCCMRGDSAIADPENQGAIWYLHGSHGIAETDGGQNQGFPRSASWPQFCALQKEERSQPLTLCAHTHFIDAKPRLERRLTLDP